MPVSLRQEGAEIFVPGISLKDEALKRTTHMAVGAHPDDLEIMAFEGILKCFQSEDNWFLGVIVTDGKGSPRDGLYADYSDDKMRAIRRKEQKKAAVLGEYTAVAFLDYSSGTVRDLNNSNPTEDIEDLAFVASPSAVYTHSLFDKHDTHVAVALRTIEALRKLPEKRKPASVYGCEVWKSLDFLVDTDKIVFDVSLRENLAASLLGLFDSQISGGKRYDLATLGRRRANATYLETHGVDVSTSAIYAMDLTPLILDPGLSIEEYTMGYLRRFQEEVLERIKQFM